MKPFWDDHPEIERELDAVKQTILAQAETDNPDIVAAVRTMIGSSGKMLRPGLVILASRFGEPDRGRILRIAASIEMLHMATLVHDDIIDDAPLRRGIATMNALRGPRFAVLVGDWLLAASLALVADLAEAEDARSLALIVARICQSEISQSTDRFVVNPSVRRYMRRIAGKTAALFSLSLFVGAQQSGCGPQVTETLRRLGYCIGMGFQIIDDILDFSSSGAEIGKPAGNDLSQGIFTLPVIPALRRDKGLARELERRGFSRRRVARLTRAIVRDSGIDNARGMAEAYTRRAIAEIGKLPQVPARDMLRDVTEKLLVRTY